jgi:sugar lactone lactonase YvrE
VWGGIFEFSKDQLSSGGSIAPVLTILPTDSADAPPLTLQWPSGLAFDSSGALWVAYAYGYDQTNAGGVVMYSPDQLNAIGTIAPTPAITLARNNTVDPRNYNIYSPNSLAFDKMGDLWVANEAPNTINKFPPDQLTGGAPPVPTIRLFSNLPTWQRPIINFFHPNLIAFGPVVEKPRPNRSR